MQEQKDEVTKKTARKENSEKKRKKRPINKTFLRGKTKQKLEVMVINSLLSITSPINLSPLFKLPFPATGAVALVRFSFCLVDFEFRFSELLICSSQSYNMLKRKISFDFFQVKNYYVYKV